MSDKKAVLKKDLVNLISMYGTISVNAFKYVCARSSCITDNYESNKFDTKISISMFIKNIDNRTMCIGYPNDLDKYKKSRLFNKNDFYIFENYGLYVKDFAQVYNNALRNLSYERTDLLQNILKDLKSGNFNDDKVSIFLKSKEQLEYFLSEFLEKPLFDILLDERKIDTFNLYEVKDNKSGMFFTVKARNEIEARNIHPAVFEPSIPCYTFLERSEEEWKDPDCFVSWVNRDEVYKLSVTLLQEDCGFYIKQLW